MSFWDLIQFLETDWNAIIGSVTGGIVAIVGAIGAILVKLENTKRRENCADPKCCLTGRKLNKTKKTKKSSSNEKTKN